jgi:rhodanese-related sulfurtransferase
MQEAGSPALIVDSRTERTYADSNETIPDAIRLSPDEAVRAATQLKVPKDRALAVLCA